MGKLMDNLQKQLKDLDNKENAKDCIELYEWLQSTDAHIWSSKWQVLTDVKFKGFPSDERTYKPSIIGYAVLKGIRCKD